MTNKPPRQNVYGYGQIGPDSRYFELANQAKTLSGSEKIPSQEEVGVDTEDWASVHAAFYADPATAVGSGATMQVRPWRYYKTLREGAGTNLGPGGWVADAVYNVAIDPQAAGAGNAPHRVFETRGASKMFWQITSQSEVGNVDWLRLQVWGYGKDDATLVVGTASAGGGGGAVPDPLNVIIVSPLPLPVDPPYSGPEDDPVPGEAAFVGAYATDSQRAPVDANGDLIGLTTNRFGELVLAGFNWVAQALRVEEIAPIYTYQDVIGEIAEVPLTAPPGTIVNYIDLFGFESHSLQVIVEHLGEETPDLIAMDIYATNVPTVTPGALAATDWTPVNTEIFATSGQAPLSNVLGAFSKMFYLDQHLSNRWLRLRAYRVSGSNDNVNLWINRKSWY